MPALGMDRRTGRRLAGWPHVVQSIEDILTTPVLSRVMRRPYGSETPRLIDAPMNASSLLALYVAIAEALELWEPRYELQHIAFTEAGADGRASIALAGTYYPDGHKGDRTPDNGEEKAVSLVLLSEGIWRSS